MTIISKCKIDIATTKKYYYCTKFIPIPLQKFHMKAFILKLKLIFKLINTRGVKNV